MHKISQQQAALGSSVQCFRCGRTNHKAPQCRFKDLLCSYCNKKGHLARACRSKQSGLKGKLPTHLVAEELEEYDDKYSLYTIQDARVNKASTDPLDVTLRVNGKPTVMEVDTGAAISTMAETNFNEIAAKLNESPMNLRMYSREKLNVVGVTMCNVEYSMLINCMCCPW